MRTLTTAVVGAAAVLTLAACSGSAQSDASKTAEAARSAAAAKTTQPDGSVGARKELSKEACTADKDGAWSFKGTLTNGQQSDQTYVVTASVVDGRTFTVLGSKELTQKLAPGKSVDLKADKFFTKKADGVQCVLRVTRKTA